jgi:hypothetical protein
LITRAVIKLLARSAKDGFVCIGLTPRQGNPYKTALRSVEMVRTLAFMSAMMVILALVMAAATTADWSLATNA